MKKSILALCFMPILTGLKAQSCKSVQLGKFKIHNEKTGVTFISRTDNYQIEENKTLDIKMMFTIVWIDDCTYELRPYKLLSGNPRFFIKDIIITTVITEVKKHGYKAVCSNNLYTGTQTYIVEITE